MTEFQKVLYSEKDFAKIQFVSACKKGFFYPTIAPPFQSISKPEMLQTKNNTQLKHGVRPCISGDKELACALGRFFFSIVASEALPAVLRRRLQ
jgi:hypothetical protein